MPDNSRIKWQLKPQSILDFFWHVCLIVLVVISTIMGWIFSPIVHPWRLLKRHPDSQYCDEEDLAFDCALRAKTVAEQTTGVRNTLLVPRGNLHSPLYYKLTDPFRRWLYTADQWKSELAWRTYKATLKREARERHLADEAARKLLGE